MAIVLVLLRRAQIQLFLQSALDGARSSLSSALAHVWILNQEWLLLALPLKIWVAAHRKHL